jgi:hypothetical protein
LCKDVTTRKGELNQTIVDLSREDFLAGNFDLKSLFAQSFDRFHSGDFVLWLGAEDTLLEVGMASILSFRARASVQDAEVNFITDWETVFGGAYATGRAIRWRTVRAWKSRRVIAERIESLPSPER